MQVALRVDYTTFSIRAFARVHLFWDPRPTFASLQASKAAEAMQWWDFTGTLNLTPVGISTSHTAAPISTRTVHLYTNEYFGPSWKPSQLLLPLLSAYA